MLSLLILFTKLNFKFKMIFTLKKKLTLTNFGDKIKYYSKEEISNLFSLEIKENETSLVDDFNNFDMIRFDFLIDNIKIGYGSFKLKQFNKSIQWKNFYPVYEYPNLKFSNGYFKKKHNKNLGTLCHNKVLVGIEDYIFNNYGVNINNWDIYHLKDFTSYSRRCHLDKMEIDYTKKYKFEDYKNKSINYSLNSGFNENIINYK